MLKEIKKHCSGGLARIRQVSKEVAWVIAGQVFTVIGMLVLIRVLTEYLEPEDYGELALALTAAAFINQVIMGGLSSGISRFYSIAVEQFALKSYIKSAVVLISIATLMVLLLFTVFIYGIYSVDYEYLISLIVAVLFFSLLSSYNGVLNGVQNAARQRSVVAVHNVLDSWLKVIFSLILVSIFDVSSLLLLIGYIFSLVIVVVSQFFFFKGLIKQKLLISKEKEITEEASWRKKIWQFSWPFSIFGIFTWAQQISGQWALEVFSTTSDVGQYAVIFQLGYVPIGLVTRLMITLIGPILYQRSGSATDHQKNKSVHHIAWRITQLCLLVTLLTFVFTWNNHGWVFGILVSLKYQEISHYLPWVVLGGGFFASGQMLALKLMSEMRPKSLLAVKIITALIGIAANIYGAWSHGVSGVVYALLLFSIIYFLWMVVLTFRIPNASSNIYK